MLGGRGDTLWAFKVSNCHIVFVISVFEIVTLYLHTIFEVDYLKTN
jgi:hypothetical protein